MNKFVIIIPYFGKFKPSIVLFLESCNRNSGIDWLIFTDCDIPKNIHLNSNIRWIKTDLENIKKLAEDQLHYEVNLTHPYKLCDLKPMYGLIFADYISNYKYWGYGDIDVIYGNLLGYLIKIGYSKYKKINLMGHLCFIYNSKQTNILAMEEIQGTISPKIVLTHTTNYSYDERDFNKKCKLKNWKIYDRQWAADIDAFYWRMRCADLKTFHYLLKMREVKWAPKNYSKQIFAILNGNVYRVYLKNRKIYKEEFAYIHFRKEGPINLSDITRDNFIVSRDGFFPVKQEDFTNYKKVYEMIMKYNYQQDSLHEWIDFLSLLKRKTRGKKTKK